MKVVTKPMDTRPLPDGILYRLEQLTSQAQRTVEDRQLRGFLVALEPTWDGISNSLVKLTRAVRDLSHHNENQVTQALYEIRDIAYDLQAVLDLEKQAMTQPGRQRANSAYTQMWNLIKGTLGIMEYTRYFEYRMPWEGSAYPYKPLLASYTGIDYSARKNVFPFQEYGNTPLCDSERIRP